MAGSGARELILASTSPYRKRLLERLQLEFRCLAPGIEEHPLPGEDAAALAGRLALAKARAVAANQPDALVIGSDQAAELAGTILGKPGSAQRAAAQLRACAGRSVQFHTGVALVCAACGLEEVHVVPFAVEFRRLDDGEIARYLERDQPWDCAGSFKVESLGIALFSALRGDDPSSLEGLPLIRLGAMLRRAGLQLP